nr:hypothetical protein [Terribacillus saccharophilus]
MYKERNCYAVFIGENGDNHEYCGTTVQLKQSCNITKVIILTKDGYINLTNPYIHKGKSFIHSAVKCVNGGEEYGQT